ncbi:hypothetical protein AYI70_g3273 [Smittium culicis]|uniref:Uncharacterized protein n=1 Tax=Smittium culicis TaxID=133412 RepID=A0A1R1Y4K7_9FUNG|nr:hypothetical protein AYI70_g3273 [Smittium culicis]
METRTSWRPIEKSVDLAKEILDNIEKIKNDLPEIRENGFQKMLKLKRKEKGRYDKGITESSFKIGEAVLKLIESKQAKLEQRWEGPF